MNDKMAIEEGIRSFFRINGTGRERARNRHVVKSATEDWCGFTIQDVEFRAVYAKMPDICTCEDGLFVPTTKQDLLDFKTYLEKKAIPLFDRWKRVHEHYRESLLEREQMDLFGKVL